MFRLHILANSDTKADQDLKLLVRDDVLQACTFFSDCQSVTEAQQAAENNLQRITEIARQRIRQEGYNYQVTARVVREYFNTRVYENVTLPAGYYNALKIEIGAGAGHNWWCVLYPSLCFTNATCAVVDEDGKKELKEALSAEEYEMVTAASEFKIKWFFFGNSDKNTEEEHTKESD